MAHLVTDIIDGYNDLMENKSDPRHKTWFMVSSPFPTILICLTYVYCVKVLGPRLMQDRKPFDIKKVLIFYNLFQVVINAHLFYEIAVGAWFKDYNFRCQPVDYSLDPAAIRILNAAWLYYISKLTDLADTVFFVLRKKYDHISILHLFHHGIMPIAVWFGLKFVPGGNATFFGFLNTFIHVVMYSYYLLAALGPQYQKYLWWKKYLTALQIGQFVLVGIHSFQLLFIECSFPKGFAYYIGLLAVIFCFLFLDFYRNAYAKKTKKVVETDCDVKEAMEDSNEKLKRR